MARTELTSFGKVFAAILALGVWEHAMQTSAQVLAAIVITMAFGVTAGVLAARSDTFSRVIRPINDAAQTLAKMGAIVEDVTLRFSKELADCLPELNAACQTGERQGSISVTLQVKVLVALMEQRLHQHFFQQLDFFSLYEVKVELLITI